MQVWIPGTPIPKGSMIQGRYGGIHDGNKKVGPWRDCIAAACTQVITDPPMQDPLAMKCRFVFKRPRSHFGTGRNSGKVRLSARRTPGRPDIDKLARTVMDALTGILYIDDSQVVTLVCSKEYGSASGLDLTWAARLNCRFCGDLYPCPEHDDLESLIDVS
jgi:Holliday junction resolvase RusA-like endonuclease